MSQGLWFTSCELSGAHTGDLVSHGSLGLGFRVLVVSRAGQTRTQNTALETDAEQD